MGYKTNENQSNYEYHDANCAYWFAFKSVSQTSVVFRKLKTFKIVSTCIDKFQIDLIKKRFFF